MAAEKQKTESESEHLKRAASFQAAEQEIIFIYLTKSFFQARQLPHSTNPFWN